MFFWLYFELIIVISTAFVKNPNQTCSFIVREEPEPNGSSLAGNAADWGFPDGFIV